MSDGDRTDFVVHQDKLGLVIGRDGRTKARIERLFDVAMDLTSHGQPDGEWVTLCGHEDNRRKAQEFIINSLCYPEEVIRVEFPAHMKAELIGKNGQNHQLLETKSGAVVVFRDDNVAEIRGSSLAVVMAQSIIEEQTRSYNARREESSSSPDPRDPEMDRSVRLGAVPNTTTHGYQNHGFLRNQGCGHVEDILSLQKADGLDGKPTRKTAVRITPTLSHAAAVAADPSIMVFSKKLGYSEQDVIRVIERLGPEADRNAVLDALLKLARGGQLKQQPENTSLTLTPRPVSTKPALRPIVIDGSNVAMRHGNNHLYSCRGIGLCVDYFLGRGHRQITVFVPSWRKEKSSPDHPVENQEVLYALEKDNYLVFTPSRKVQGKRIVCYDDRFIVRLAAETGGVIVSNDTYQDLLKEDNPEWKEVIERRLLMYTFVGDIFMAPDDPLGRKGPKLDDFLRYEPTTAASILVASSSRMTGQVDYRHTVCPYLGKCTYGSKCKYKHPDREQQQQTAVDHQLYAPPVSTTPASTTAAPSVQYSNPPTTDKSGRQYGQRGVSELRHLTERDLLGRGGFTREPGRDYPTEPYQPDEQREYQLTAVSRGQYQTPDQPHGSYQQVEHPVQRYNLEDRAQSQYRKSQPSHGVYPHTEARSVYQIERSQVGYHPELVPRGQDTRMPYAPEPAYRPQYEHPVASYDDQYGDYYGSRGSTPARVPVYSRGLGHSDPYYHDHSDPNARDIQGEYAVRGVAPPARQYRPAVPQPHLPHYAPGDYYQQVHRPVARGSADVQRRAFSPMTMPEGQASRPAHVTDNLFHQATRILPSHEQRFREALTMYPYITSVQQLLEVVLDNAVPM